MTELSAQQSKTNQKSFKDFCVYFGSNIRPSNEEEPFVGVKIQKNGEPRIYFPRGYRPGFSCGNNMKINAELKSDFFRLITIICDESIRNYFPTEEKNDVQIDFPIHSFFAVMQYYLDSGYFTESETVYKKGWSGKISWSKTIKNIKPQLVKDENGDYNIVYLNMITRRASYKEDNLITLIHKYCVFEAAKTIGPLLDLSENEFEVPEIDFDYELFIEVLKEKISLTFNDKFLNLFHSLLTVVEYLHNKTFSGDEGTETYFGFKKFDHVWEAMVDKIFGTVSNKNLYNPHLKYVAENASEKNLESDGDTGERLRSTLRPDTIMRRDTSIYVLDSKYYRFGLTKNPSHLPGAESICKQMAYAEYVEKTQNPEYVYNAFVMPYCCTETSKSPYGMKRVGFIYGDWKDIGNASKLYHKIACILLDMKSVMRNYTSNGPAQEKLATIITKN